MLSREQRANLIFQCGIIATAAICFGLIWATEGEGHEAPGSDFVYPPACCNSAATHPTGDCAPISDKFVTARPDGWHLDIPVGSHPKLKTKGYSGVVPYSSARKSPDGRPHVCLSTDGAHRFCYFAPPMGS